MESKPVHIKVEEKLTKKEFLVIWILLVIARFLCEDEQTKKEIGDIKTHIYLHTR